MSDKVLFSFTDNVGLGGDEDEVLKLTLTLLYDNEDEQYYLKESSDKYGVMSVEPFASDEKEEAFSAYFNKLKKVVS